MKLNHLCSVGRVRVCASLIHPLTHISSQEWMRKKWMLNDACNDCATIPPKSHRAQEEGPSLSMKCNEEIYHRKWNAMVWSGVKWSHQSSVVFVFGCVCVSSEWVRWSTSCSPWCIALIHVQHCYWWFLKTQRSQSFVMCEPRLAVSTNQNHSIIRMCLPLIHESNYNYYYCIPNNELLHSFLAFFVHSFD